MPTTGRPPPTPPAPPSPPGSYFESQAEAAIRARLDHHGRELAAVRADQSSLAGSHARQGELVALIWEGLQMLLRERGLEPPKKIEQATVPG